MKVHITRGRGKFKLFHQSLQKTHNVTHFLEFANDIIHLEFS